MPSSARGLDRALFTLIEFELACGLVVGVLILLAGMGDPGPGSAPRPWWIQILPVSGFVVIGICVASIRAIRDRARTPASVGRTLLAAGTTFVGVALWVQAATDQRTAAGVSVAIASLPILTGALLKLRAGRSSAIARELS